jgi:four helix bundle protein
MKITKIEELKIWLAAIDLVTVIYNLTKNEKYNRDFGLRDQIRKSAVSIPSNIAEGFERGNNKEFRFFLSISKGSCGELKTQIIISKNLGYIQTSEQNMIIEKVDYISKGIYKLINHIKQNLKK